MKHDATIDAVAAWAFARAANDIEEDLRLLHSHLRALAEYARILSLEDRLTEEAVSLLVHNALRLEAWLRPGSLN